LGPEKEKAERVSFLKRHSWGGGKEEKSIKPQKKKNKGRGF